MSTQVLTAEKFNYYIVYQYRGGSVGSTFVRRTTAIDNEDALLEEHQRLEQEHGGPVVIIDWKRID